MLNRTCLKVPVGIGGIISRSSSNESTGSAVSIIKKLINKTTKTKGKGEPEKVQFGKTVYQSLRGRDLITFDGYTRNDIYSLLWTATELKAFPDLSEAFGSGKNIALIWTNPIIKASVSEATHKLSASLCCIHENQIAGVSNNYEMLGRSLAAATDAVFLDTPSWTESEIEEFAAGSQCPVISINSLHFSPALAYAELITLYEKYGFIRRLVFAYVGSGSDPMLSTYFTLLPIVGAHLRYCTYGYIENQSAWEKGLALAARNNTESQQMDSLDELLDRVHIIATCVNCVHQITLKNVKEMDLEWSYLQQDSFKGLAASKDFLRAKNHNLIYDVIRNQSRIIQALVVAHTSDFYPVSSPPRFEGKD